ncbi:serine hydrolase [Prosthecobacter sp.]|uniref:serine hydrolase n=1 Tax=Prosthecobacter sp. TaxID=1965333 RepID=UPI002ABBE45B|nr:serine hydrolase [Prosthecobacter sp.]MDZ4401835.1 serine hydrolase [Prosthecobacter sp.]
MNCLLPVLLVVLFTTNLLQARTLAEAAAQQARSLKAGCIVTGERIGDDVRFAIAGKAPEAKDTPPEKIVFEIGSITKVFTGLLLVQAVVEKKVTLETTIGSLLDSKRKLADPRIAAITLKQLSTHTSGLSRMPGNAAAGMAEGDPYANYDEKLLLDFITSTKLEGEGPYSCSYSNVGVGLLGHLLGKVYQTTWEDAVVMKICLPLGLHDTAVHPESKLPLAKPYADATEVKPWTLAAMAGAGALRSTAADMMKFGEAMLHPAQSPLKDAFALALKPHADAPAHGGQIGLGVFFGKYEGDTFLHHDGGTGGYSSSLQVIPSKSIVHVVLINNNSLSGSAVIAAMSAAKKAAPTPQKEIILPAETMQQYSGVYELDRDSRFTVLLRDGQLWVRLSGQPFLGAFARGPDRFFYKIVAAEMAFNRDKDAIQSLTLFQNGQELTAKRTSAPLPSLTLRTAKELQPYAGEYALLGFKKLNVTVKTNTLFAQLEGQPSIPVFETAPDRFEYDVVEATLVFTRDDKKQINGLTLLQNGLTLPAARVTNRSSGPTK